MTTTAQKPTIVDRLWDVFVHTWDLGFTSFGGPPTHFQIFHLRFVEKYKWLSEQSYQEVFALSQSLPGPASTKMGYSITLLHAGFVPALLQFALWSLPGAAGMYGFSIGVSSISDKLPSIVYALLSGLNSATVGIIAVAAFQLSERAITDPLTRAIVTATGGAGMLYNALWYFPLLMVISGMLTVWYDVWGGKALVARVSSRMEEIKGALTRSNTARGLDAPARRDSERAGNERNIQMETFNTNTASSTLENVQHDELKQPTPVLIVGNDTPSALPVLSHRTNRPRQSTTSLPLTTPPRTPPPILPATEAPANHTIRPFYEHAIPVKSGTIVVIVFFIIFITLMILRGTLSHPPVDFKLFSNLFLAGTIIFGGGPVVIPLLREYIVTEGWVTSRDFLLGLAVIQAFPGPNFNFAVYLAALASRHTSSPSIATAIFGFVGIFFPGMTLATAMVSIYPVIRKYRSVGSGLRGVNAGAVGLVWTAVYRLWEIGYLTPEASNGSSLGKEPWWVVCALISFVGNKWYGVPAPVSILLGGVMGLAWWGSVKA